MRTLGKYEVLEELGAGAMGKVFHARDRVLQREVAIKTISTEDADVELKQRFYREARSCGRLSHANIVTVFDLGEQQGTSYIAMEYLEGEDLRRFIDRNTFMPLEGKLQVMAEVCDGLTHAHANRIVHRDIKPSNIFLLRSGRPKILDFGIARVFASQLTRVGNALGTPEYMSPEQIKGGEADARSDIFSAAMVFFELLTYEHPFGDSDIPRRIIFEDSRPLRTLNPLIPEKLEQILNRAMAKDPEARIQSAADFAKALRKLSYEVMSNCDRLITEALQNRQKIIDAETIISSAAEASWMSKRLSDAGVDASVAGKIDPDMAKTTNASLHYFNLCSLCREIAQTASVFTEVVNEHQQICRDIELVKTLTAAGSIAEASVLLEGLHPRQSDYPEIETLRLEIQKKNAEIAEAEKQQARRRQGGATKRKDAAKAVKMEDVSAELQASRRRIAALLEDDVDKCLAEIEILPPAMAHDPVIDSYWVQALTLRNTRQAASAVSKTETPPPQADADMHLSQPALPEVDPESTANPGTAAAEPSIVAIPEISQSSTTRNSKWIAAAAVAALLIVGMLFSFRGPGPGTVVQPSEETVVPEPQPAAVAPAPDLAPAPKPRVESVNTRNKDTKVEAPAPVVLPSKQPPRRPVQADFVSDLRAAQAAFDGGNYDTARDLCDKILAAQPDNQSASNLKQRAIKAKAFEEKFK